MLHLVTLYSQKTIISHFSKTLDRLTAKRTQQEITDLTGVSRSLVSLWISEDRTPELATLDQLLPAFPRSQQIELVHAYLLDHVPASMSNQAEVSLTLDGTKRVTVEEAPGPYTSELRNALATLATAAANDKNCRAVVLDLAAIMSPGDTVHEAQAVYGEPAALISSAKKRRSKKDNGAGTKSGRAR